MTLDLQAVSQRLGLPCPRCSIIERGEGTAILGPEYAQGSVIVTINYNWRATLPGSCWPQLQSWRQHPWVVARALNAAGVMHVFRDIPLRAWIMPPELAPALTPLANEIARWTHMALEWFWLGDAAPELPLVPVEPPSQEHVKRVVEALQREIDRETNKAQVYTTFATWQTPNPKLYLQDLPWERQVSLVHLRRFSFYRYGITQQNWRRGLWGFGEVPCYHENSEVGAGEQDSG